MRVGVTQPEAAPDAHTHLVPVVQVIGATPLG